MIGSFRECRTSHCKEDEAFYLDDVVDRIRRSMFSPTRKLRRATSAVRAGHARARSCRRRGTYDNTMPGGTAPARTFVWMQGHDYVNFADPRLQPMLLRGIAWAAKHPVDELVKFQPPARAGRGR